MKADEYGWPTKATAIMVARGDEQRANVDFGSLFAPGHCCCLECSVVDSHGR